MRTKSVNQVDVRQFGDNLINFFIRCFVSVSERGTKQENMIFHLKQRIDFIRLYFSFCVYIFPRFGNKDEEDLYLSVNIGEKIF